MKVMYRNQTERTVHLGGVTILPGEAREVDAADLPRFARRSDPQAPKPTEAETLENAYSTLLGGTVQEIRDALPALGQDDLDPLLAAEQSGANRKGVIEAIETERLRRATAEAQESP